MDSKSTNSSQGGEWWAKLDGVEPEYWYRFGTWGSGTLRDHHKAQGNNKTIKSYVRS